MSKPLPRTYNCPTEFALTVLGGKWKTVILGYLSERPCSYGDLRLLLPKLSDKVLSERLRDLEACGLVARVKIGGGKRRHTYELTGRGASLGPILRDLYHWGDQHAAPFGVVVGHPLMASHGSACAA
jgi:DNA-binding HxlR family transcriptional regulator